MDIAITHMSSKGQIVIPAEMRKDIPEKETLIILKTGDSFHIKKASRMSRKLLEDIEFAKRVDAAWERYDRDPKSFKTMEFDAFLEEVRKWSKQSLMKNSRKSSSR